MVINRQAHDIGLHHVLWLWSIKPFLLSKMKKVITFVIPSHIQHSLMRVHTIKEQLHPKQAHAARISSSGGTLQTIIILIIFRQTGICNHCADMLRAPGFPPFKYRRSVCDLGQLGLSWWTQFWRSYFCKHVHNYKQNRLNLLHVLLGSLLLNSKVA